MDLTSIFVTGFIFLALYKTIELFVRRKERLLIIDKLSADNAPALDPANLANILGSEKTSSFSPLRWGCLAAGLGIGMLVSSIVYIWLDLRGQLSQIDWSIRTTLSSSLCLLGGGAGLLMAYALEKSSNKNKSTVAGQA